MTLVDENLFEERKNIPSGWVRTSLHEVVADALIGLVRAKEKQNSYGNGTPYVKMNNVTVDGKVILDDLIYVEVSSEESQRYALCEGDILFNTRNSSELVGKTGLVKGITVNPVYNNNLMRIRTASGVSPEFLSHQMCSQGFRASLEKVKRATTNVAAIYAKDLMPLRILLPPWSEQHRIAEKIEELFSKLDAGVEALRKVRAELKRYHQSVLKYAFEGKLTAEWREANKGKIEPASDLLKRIREERKEQEQQTGRKAREFPPLDTSGLPELPEGWVWARLGELIRVRSGNGLPSHKMANDGQYRVYGGNGVMGQHNDFMFEDRKLIIGRVGAKCGVVHITQPKSWVTDNALVVDFSHLVIRFLFYEVSLLDLNKFSVSTAQPVISSTKIYPLAVVIPPLVEQEKIATEIERLFSLGEAIEKTILESLRQADRLRQSILKAAFEGKLVPQDPNDEPAEKLLERIQAERAQGLSEQRGKTKGKKKGKCESKQLRLISNGK